MAKRGYGVGRGKCTRAMTAAAAVMVGAAGCASAGWTASVGAPNTLLPGRHLLAVSVNKDSVVILIIATLLVVFGILFDLFTDYLKESSGRTVKPVLDSLFSELTLLGFIGLVMFLVERTKSLNGFSEHLFGDGTELDDLVETVHMALFLIMVLFLLESLLLIQVAKRLEREWHKNELESMYPNAVIDKYVSYLITQRHRSACSKAIHRLCWGKHHSGHEYGNMVHACIRRSFVNKLSVTDEDDMLDADDNAKAVYRLVSKARSGQPVRLSRSTAQVFRKNLEVYAFETDSPVTVEKSWGTSSGKVNDWIICGSNGDVYMNSAQEFMANYEPVGPAKPNVYRKRTTILARKMPCSFVATGTNGSVSGREGYYLVQSAPNKDGVIEQYAIDPSQFEKQYVSVEAGKEKSADEIRYADFNLGRYFSIIMGEFLGEVVEIRVYTWMAVELVLVLFFSLETLFGKTVFVVGLFVSGFVMAFLLWLVLHKLQYIRDQIMERTMWLKAERKMKERVSDPLTGDMGSDDVARVVELDIETPLLMETPSVAELSRHRQIAYADRQPPYLKQKLRPRTGCGRRFLGRPANRYEQLFWFDRMGVHFLEHLVRTLMLLLAVYVAVVGILLKDYECNDAAWKCAAFYVAMLVSPFLTLLQLPRVIRLFVVVSSVEVMKNTRVIDEVTRQQRASKCLRALRLVSAIKAKAARSQEERPARHSKLATMSPVKRNHTSVRMDSVPEAEALESGDGASESKSAPPKHPTMAHPSRKHISRHESKKMRRASTSVYGRADDATYRRRRAELAEAFAMFDRDSSGVVSGEELTGVLELMGLKDEAPRLAAAIVREIDLDGDGITFEEFFEWVAEIDFESGRDRKELDESIFEFIDTNNDGTITVDELRAAILSMGEVMSYDDVVQIVREADVDNDGAIDLEEFVKMMKRHTKYLEHL